MSKKVSAEDLRHLRDVAREAERVLPGPWEQWADKGLIVAGPTKVNTGGCVSGHRQQICELDVDAFAEAAHKRSRADDYDEQQAADEAAIVADHIAAFDPTTVRLLIDRILDLELKLAGAKRLMIR